MVFNTNTMNDYMESFTNNDIDQLQVRDFSECASVMEAALQAQQENDVNWQAFNQRIARVEASYLRENGVAMVYTEANIGELIKGGIALLGRAWSNFLGILQKGIDIVKGWIKGNSDFVNKNKSKLSAGCKFPSDKEFKDYDYKTALSRANTTDIPENLVSYAKTDGFGSKYSDFVNSIGGSDGKLTTAKFKDYLVGKDKITISGNYLSSKDCIDQMTRANDLITVFKNAKQKAEKDYKSTITALKNSTKDKDADEKAIHKSISNFHKLIGLNTNMLTAKLQVCNGYIRQINKLAHIYVNAGAADNSTRQLNGSVENRNSGSSNNQLMRRNNNGNGQLVGQGTTAVARNESAVFDFDAIFE